MFPKQPTHTPTAEHATAAEFLIGLSTDVLMAERDGGRAQLARASAAIMQAIDSVVAAGEQWPVAARLLGTWLGTIDQADERGVLLPTVRQALGQDAQFPMVSAFKQLAASRRNPAAMMREATSGLQATGIEPGEILFYAGRIATVNALAMIDSEMRAKGVEARRMPDLRARLVSWSGSDHARLATGYAIKDGGTLEPLTATPEIAARVLLAQERERLSNARLYWVDEEMCGVAHRSALRGRKDPTNLRRVPSEYGFLALERPVFLRDGNYCVAMSWGPWRADYAPTDYRPDPQRQEDTGLADDRSWWKSTASAVFQGEVRDGLQVGTYGPESNGGDEPGMWWITLWSRNPVPTEATPELGWDNEAILGVETTLGTEPPREGTTEYLVRLLVSCWDLMTQQVVTKKAVVDVAEQTRKPVKVRADRRRGIVDDGKVRVVTIRGKVITPGEEPRERPEGEGPGRNYRHRWMVQEHPRSHCMDPHAHHRGDPHTHEPIIIMQHPAGPAGLPMKDYSNEVQALRGKSGKKS